MFSVLLLTSLVLVWISVPADPQDAGEWLSGGWKRVNLAMNLMPFAGIAFLWFIGMVRDRLGKEEDRFFATVFLGSGLLFLAMMFASAAVAGGIISMFGMAPGMLIDSGLYTFGRTITYEIMNINTMKMAGVFIISTCTLSLRTRIFPRWNKKIPAGLVVLFGSIAISLALSLNANYGVAVAGVLPQGLPSIALPKVSWLTVVAMILPAIGIFLLAYSEALGAAREFAEKHGYEVDPDQELNAHALTNFASGLFGGMIASGGMSATAVKEGAGARTQIANIVAWGVTVVTLLLLTPLFASLPEAVLAALIIQAVWHIITARKLEKIRLVSRTEFWLAALTLAGVLFIDVLQGMIIGLVASVLLIIYKSSRPHVASLGRVPGMPGAYSDLHRHPECTPVPGTVILRLDAPMYYANALTVRERIKALVAETQPPPRAVVLDSAGQDSLDITSADVLKALLVELKGKAIDVYVAEVHAPVREFSQRTGLYEMIGEDHIFPTVDTAVRFIEMSRETS